VTPEITRAVDRGLQEFRLGSVVFRVVEIRAPRFDVFEEAVFRGGPLLMKTGATIVVLGV